MSERAPGPRGPGSRGGRRATTRVREWLRDRIDPTERGATSKLAEAAVEWLQAEEDLLDEFLYEHLFDITAELVRAVMSNTRRVQRWKEMVDEPENVRRVRLQAWMDRMEHVSPEIGYVRLGSMTRPDLEIARLERGARIQRDGTALRWYALLGDGLPDDTVTVEQRYTPFQVEQLYESAASTITKHMEGILAGVDETLRTVMGQTPPAPPDPPSPPRRPRRPVRNGNGS